MEERLFEREKAAELERQTRKQSLQLSEDDDDFETSDNFEEDEDDEE
jgi:hypothetical protein